MQQAFDTIATRSTMHRLPIALLEKHKGNIVWDYLEKTFLDNNKLNILELNCGTGEDALWFAKQGHKVLATDLSEKHA